MIGISNQGNPLRKSRYSTISLVTSSPSLRRIITLRLLFTTSDMIAKSFVHSLTWSPSSPELLFSKASFTLPHKSVFTFVLFMTSI
jgi:hypothetical protein